MLIKAFVVVNLTKETFKEIKSTLKLIFEAPNKFWGEKNLYYRLISKHIHNLFERHVLKHKVSNVILPEKHSALREIF